MNITMKKVLLSFLLAVISLPLLAQVPDKPLIYDYEATRHEIAMDIIPIFGGNIPTSFFYRKNYTGANERQVGFRLGLIVGNQSSTNDMTINNTDFTRETRLDYFLSLGKEWQTPLTNNFIGYRGVDLGVGFNSQRFHGIEGRMAGPGDIVSYRFQDITYNVTGFWGVKYHLLSRLSVFAEMGIAASYIDSSTFVRQNFFDSSSERINTANNFKLNLLPVRTLRVAYHF